MEIVSYHLDIGGRLLTYVYMSLARRNQCISLSGLIFVNYDKFFAIEKASYNIPSLISAVWGIHSWHVGQSPYRQPRFGAQVMEDSVVSQATQAHDWPFSKQTDIAQSYLS